MMVFDLKNRPAVAAGQPPTAPVAPKANRQFDAGGFAPTRGKGLPSPRDLQP
jgi:hypothetical protein